MFGGEDLAKQRLKTIRAGNFIRTVLYTQSNPSDTEKARAEKAKISGEARRRINARTSWQKLQLLIECNFGPGDNVLVLNYDHDHLPRNRQEARRRIKSFIRLLRQQPEFRRLKYIYNIEGRHTAGRTHHHMLLNASRDLLPKLCDLWRYGTAEDVHMEAFDLWGSKELAQYLTKEARDDGTYEAGVRTWACSQNLERPEVLATVWVDADVRLEPPLNAHVVLREEVRNEWGSYSYLEYRLPPPPNQKKVRRRSVKIK